jgi:hypothetical protein
MACAMAANLALWIKALELRSRLFTPGQAWSVFPGVAGPVIVVFGELIP